MTEDRHDDSLPATQNAIQLVGPGRLVLNHSKEVPQPGARQIVAKVEAVSLCFSDLKLLNQFSAHPRKGEIVSGIAPEVLRQIPSYVPGELATVPGHEVSCRIVAVGSEVARHKVGERCLVQTDYRTLPTKGSNAAFGYNFEGGLQEYVLMDERVVVDSATGVRSLICVPEEPSASAVALVEPWACVENSYATTNRRTLAPGGRLAVVVENGHAVAGLADSALHGSPPAFVTIVASEKVDCGWAGPAVKVTAASEVRQLSDAAFDDIVYFGASKPTIDVLNDKLAAGAIMNVVLGGAVIGAPVSVGVGRIHYEATRWIGTVGSSAADSYASVPPSGELRAGDSVLAVGAAGPMGQMHILRSLSADVDGLTVVGTDLDDARLRSLAAKAGPLADANGVSLRLVNTSREQLVGSFSYQVILVPMPSLVADAIANSEEQGLINIFAGIAVATRQDIDLDTYIAAALLHVRIERLGRERHGSAAGQDRCRAAGHQSFGRRDLRHDRRSGGAGGLAGQDDGRQDRRVPLPARGGPAVTRRAQRRLPDRRVKARQRPLVCGGREGTAEGGRVAAPRHRNAGVTDRTSTDAARRR